MHHHVNILHFSILIYHVRLIIVSQCGKLLLPSARNLIMKYTPFRANYVRIGACCVIADKRGSKKIAYLGAKSAVKRSVSLVYRGATSATKRLIRLGAIAADDSRESRFRSLTIASGTLIAFKRTVSARIAARRKHL